MFSSQAPHNEVSYELMENQGKINDLFMVDDVTGEVFLRQSLLDENEERFEVRILQFPILFNFHAYVVFIVSCASYRRWDGVVACGAASSGCSSSFPQQTNSSIHQPPLLHPSQSVRCCW